MSHQIKQAYKHIINESPFIPKQNLTPGINFTGILSEKQKQILQKIHVILKAADVDITWLVEGMSMEGQDFDKDKKLTITMLNNLKSELNDLSRSQKEVEKIIKDIKKLETFPS